MYTLVTLQDGVETYRSEIDGAEYPEDAVRFGLESEPVQSGLLAPGGSFVVRIEGTDGLLIAKLEVNTSGVAEFDTLPE